MLKKKSAKKALIIGIALVVGTLLISNSHVIAGGDCYNYYPCIDVTKECIDAGARGEPIFFYGTVTNCSQYKDLQVELYDYHNGLLLDPFILEPSQSLDYDGSYIPEESPSTNYIKAVGTPLDHYGRLLSYKVVKDWDKATCIIRDGVGCRMTGGGNATAGDGGSGSWDGTFANGKSNGTNGNGNGVSNRYTFGGNVGANTALPPQPKAEWTHHQKSGPDGSFLFHAGTASAPPGTEIDEIICSDEGWCNPARKAPTKQIDWIGVGTFKNMKNPSQDLEANVTVGESLHCFEAHAEDLGEPGKKGNKNPGWPGGDLCPENGSNDLFSINPVSDIGAACDCPDYYRIRIYSQPTIITEGGKYCDGDVIYSVGSYLNGGNIQIHPLTGFDLK